MQFIRTAVDTCEDENDVPRHRRREGKSGAPQHASGGGVGEQVQSRRFEAGFSLCSDASVKDVELCPKMQRRCRVWVGEQEAVHLDQGRMQGHRSTLRKISAALEAPTSVNLSHGECGGVEWRVERLLRRPLDHDVK